MHLALYRKWRPRVFADVYGQDHVTSVLRREVATGKISHAYLFCGSRGTGKTSCAKILAKAVNCESPVEGEPCGVCSSCRLIDDGSATDVLELDAASNNGVENVRDIRDEVIYTPAVLRRRVYIIDEVHMLSVAAFNALLKTLEEPPEHVVFILATTEPQKLPATIVSRCQRFDFRRIDTESIVRRLNEIAAAEGIALDSEAATLIARLSQGGMRDAVSTLELCAGDGSPVTEEKVRAVTGAADRGLLLSAVQAVLEHDTEAIFAVIDRVYASSVDITVFWGDLVGLYRDLLVIKSTKNPRAYLDLTESELEETAALAKRFSGEALSVQSELADEALVRMTRAGSQKRLIAELSLVRMANPRLGGDVGALAERVAELEAALERPAAGGLPAAAASAAVPSTEGQGRTGTSPSDTHQAEIQPEVPHPAEGARDADAGRTDAGQAARGGDSPPWEVENEPTPPHPAETPRAEAKPAQSEPTPAVPTRTAAESAAKKPADGPGKPYMRWADAVERLHRIAGYEAEAGFLELAGAIKSDGGFTVMLEGAMMLSFVDTPDVKARLAEIISTFEGRTVSPDEIRFTAGTVKTAQTDNFDDFNL